MKHPVHSLLLLAALCLSSGLLHAEKADRDKPMNVEADALRYDDLRQASVFTGRVVLTKGTILIRGARVDVREDPEGYQFGLVVAEPGKLAFFRQKREGLDEYIEGEGETIEYDGRADTVRFVRTAQLRRYRGATLSDEFNGAVIVYNNQTDVFTIDGTPGKTKSEPQGRIRAMLTPKADPNKASAPPANTAPLRASPLLNKDAK